MNTREITNAAHMDERVRREIEQGYDPEIAAVLDRPEVRARLRAEAEEFIKAPVVLKP